MNIIDQTDPTAAPYDLSVEVTISAVTPQTIFKLQSDTLRLQLDYSRWLAAGDALASVIWTVATQLATPLAITNVFLSASYDGIPLALATFFLTSGSPGPYNVSFVAISTGISGGPPATHTDTLSFLISGPASIGYPGGYPISDPAEEVALPTIWFGSGAPWPTLGNNGDYFTDETLKVFYGPKVAGAWPQQPTYSMPSWYNPNAAG